MKSAKAAFAFMLVLALLPLAACSNSTDASRSEITSLPSSAASEASQPVTAASTAPLPSSDSDDSSVPPSSIETASEAETATEPIPDPPQIVLEPYHADENADPLFPAFDPETELKGYINNKGEWVIEPQYLIALDFNDGVANIRMDTDSGERDMIINKQGEVLYIDNVPNKYEKNSTPYIDGIDENLIRVVVNLKMGLADFEGNWIVRPIFDRISTFQEGLARAWIGDKFGYINQKGEWVISPRFDYNPSFGDYSIGFSGGLATVPVNEQWGYIDKNGDWIIEPQYDSAQDFCEEYASVEIDGKWGVIDKEGTWVIEPSFGQIYLSPYGVKHGVISADKEYHEVAAFQNGLIDLNGNWITEPIYINSALVFSDDGVASAGIEMTEHRNVITCGVIDIQGNWVIEPRFFGSVDFKHGLARVSEVIDVPEGVDAPMGFFSFRRGYIDLQGNWIYSYEEYN